MPSPKPTSLDRTIVFVALTVLGAALFAEGAALVSLSIADGELYSPARLTHDRNAVSHSADPESDAERRSMIVVHPYLGFVYNPEADSPVLRAQHGMPISEHGFLDDKSVIRRRSEDKILIGITGGSVGAVFGVQGVPSLFEELGRHPGFRGKELEVVRLALGGYKAPQPLMALSYLLSQGGELDVLINLDGFNDIVLPLVGNLRHGVHPSFPSGWHNLSTLLPEPPVLLAVGRIGVLQARRRRWAERFSRPPLPWSPVAQSIWRVGDRRAADRLGDARKDLNTIQGEVDAGYVTSGPEFPQSGTDAIERIADLWQIHSRALDKLARAHGIRYVHFLQPNQYVPASKPMGEEERELAWNERHPYRPAVEVGYPLLQARGRVLRDEGVEFHDLTAVFAGTTEPVYIDDCCHISLKANRQLAHAIALALVE